MTPQPTRRPETRTYLPIGVLMLARATSSFGRIESVEYPKEPPDSGDALEFVFAPILEFDA